MTTKIQGHALVAGSAQGEAVFTKEPLSFWGGYDAQTGNIIDRHHELYGTNVAGKILILPGGRGSSTGSGILVEAIRRGTAPRAMILKQPDPILALGAIVGRELYNRVMPLIVVSESDFARLQQAQVVRIEIEQPARQFGDRGGSARVKVH